jgi:alpha-L-fucosidase
MFSERELAYTPQDMRFTTKDGALYVFVMAPPSDAVTVKSLAAGSEFAQPVASVKLLGSDEQLQWDQGQDGLVIAKPAILPSLPAAAGEHVVAFKVTFE